MFVLFKEISDTNGTLSSLTEDVLKRICEYAIRYKSDACMLIHISTNIWMPQIIQKICLQRGLISYSDITIPYIELINISRFINNKINMTLNFIAPTYFDAKEPPLISISDYIERISIYTHINNAILIIAIILIDRLLKSDNGIKLCYKNAHRLIIAAALIASKLLDDYSYSNAYYATVGGISHYEMNTLERCFLISMNWDIAVSDLDFQEAIYTLKKMNKSYI